MAVSMKDVDPAFRQGVGHKAGLEIWEIENNHLSALPKAEHGMFSSRKCYIVLQTRAVKGGLLSHDLHYWIGSSTSENEAVVAAIKAVELNASLGWRSLQVREGEGHESDKFLSYFKPCIIPIRTETTLTTSTKGGHQNRLFSCEGRHIIRVKEVPFSRSSLNHDYVFILDTESKIFQFNGFKTDLYQRAKALDVVKYLKENFHNEECQIAVIEDGKFVADADSGEFWGQFGGYAPLMKKVDDKDSLFAETKTGTLYTVIEGRVDELKARSPEREMMNSNKSYILDCENELFTWMGHNTPLQDRKAAVKVAEEYRSKCHNALSVKLTHIVEGSEPVEFRKRFRSWPANTTLPIAQGGRGKVAVLLKQKGFNVNGLVKSDTTRESLQLMSNIGKLQVWRVNGKLKDSLTPTEHGKLFTNFSYVVHHTCLNKKEHFVCSWLGLQSNMETRKSAINHANEITASLQGNVVEVRVFEGKEPTQFLSLFDKLFIMKNNENTGGLNLFQVRRSDSLRWHAVEVAPAATSLNSSSCYILQKGNNCFTWYGKFSTVEEQEATKNMASHLKADIKLTMLKEGSETHYFWDALGGKESYPSDSEPRDSAKDPRLFSCFLERGQAKFKEVFSFTQEDFLSDEVMIVDCYTEIFVWIGQATNSQLKLKALDMGQRYLDQAAKYEGISLEAPIYKIAEGCEPSFFMSLLNWDSNIRMEHQQNSFDRKVLALKGEPIQTTETSRFRRRSSQPELKGFQLPAEKPKLNKTSIFKPEHTMDKARQSKNKVGQVRAAAKPAAVTLLSTMFELQGGREAPPNTPIVKFSTLTVRTPRAVESTGNSPPATPRHSRTPSATPRHSKTPVSPAIATLASVFETYQDRFAFAWPGMKPRYEEKESHNCFDTFTYGEGNAQEDSYVEEDEQESPKSFSQAAPVVATKVELEDTYPYERLKVSSNNPVQGIDSSKRESYLSSKDFQELFRMDKDTFYKLPKWKQDKYKMFLDLF